MNDQIADILTQPAFDRLKDWYDIGPVQKATLELFAQLIVLECYEHCKGQVLDKEDADTNELTYNDAVGDCANGLLQHFGVE